MGSPACRRGLLTALLLSISTTAFGITIVDQPLDPTGYGYTSHEGQQQMFDHFELQAGALVNQVSWYGQFSDGLAGNGQSVADFNVFLFRSDPEGETISPEGVITVGTPSDALVAVRSQSSTGVGTGFADPLHGGEIKMWELDLPTLYLEPGKYWISICAAFDEDGFYLWNHSSGTVDGVDFGGSVSPSNEPRIWSSSSLPERDSMAFSIEYITVPDASSGWALMSMSMMVVFGLERKLRQRTARS